MSPDTDYRLDFASPQDGNVAARLARAWLALGIAALIGAGLLALLLGMARTPGLQGLFPSRDFFRSALVVHVDLSVLIWFMAFAGVLWSLAGSARLATLGWLGVALGMLGTALMTVSPLFPDAHPLLNNYIPVLDQPVFFVGLSLAGGGFACAILRALLTIELRMTPKVGAGGTAVRAPDGADALRFGAWLAAVAGALSVLATLTSLATVPDAEPQAFWEMVFWGGGHALQFQHVLLAIVAWFWLASELGAAPALSGRAAHWLFGLAALPLLAVPLIYLHWPAGSAFHTAQFARLMEAGHPFSLPLMIFAFGALWQVMGRSAPAKSALLASLLLFTVGGALAFMIKGINVVIPAHYHGSIVGVTLAFMGLSYLLLPRLGFGEAHGRMARWQPYVYGGGQLLHIGGLAWSGGYGVQRKVAGAEQVLHTLPQKIGMGMMGLGTLIAVFGGALFIVVCLRAMWPRHNAATATTA